MVTYFVETVIVFSTDRIMDLSTLILFGLLLAAGLTAGYFQLLRISQLTWKRLKITTIAASICLVFFALLNWLNFLPALYGRMTSIGLYLLATGFFLGSSATIALRQYQSGQLEYINAALLPVLFPKLLSAAIILFGMYRTQLFSADPVTAIGLNSGISLAAFGCYGWIIQIIPAFREKGILILDSCIPWSEVLSFSWQEQNLLNIEYYDEIENINELQTIIPEQDQKEVTNIIESHILERTLE